MLKAVIVSRTGQFPPRIHDLLRLSQVAGLTLDEHREKLLGRLSAYYIETRYPQEVQTLMREVDKRLADDMLTETKEMLEWLEQQMS